MLSGVEAQQNGSDQAKFAARNDRSAFPDSIGTQADDQGFTFGQLAIRINYKIVWNACLLPLLK